jgi:hypothetical protein
LGLSLLELLLLELSLNKHLSLRLLLRLDGL